MRPNAPSSSLTPAARRVVDRCRLLMGDHESPDHWAGMLVLALLRDESLASACLRRAGITDTWLAAGGLGRFVAAAANSEASVSDDDASVDLLSDGNLADCSGSIAGVGMGCALAPGGLDDGLMEPDSVPRRPEQHIRRLEDPDEFTRILDRSVALCRRSSHDDGVSSSHLLLAVLEVSQFVRECLQRAGFSADCIAQDLGLETGQQLPLLAVDCTLRLEDQPYIAPPVAVGPAAASGPDSIGRIWRVLDAGLNRAREGLRVLEDHARFVDDHPVHCRRLKELRHALVDSEQRLLSGEPGPDAERRRAARPGLVFRDTMEDVGTSLSTPGELTRGSCVDLVTANCRRVQEALRSLEEFGKLVAPPFAVSMKQLRYQMYQLEQSLLCPEAVLRAREPESATNGPPFVEAGSRSPNRVQRLLRLNASRLYVLVTERFCQLPWQQYVEQLLDGGADVIQLREKQLNDADLLRRARWFVDACRAAGALSIINDRPDLGMLAGADGVHVGQEELSVEDVRRVIDSEMLLGVSTHNMAQVAAAVGPSVDYIGTGPVFPSGTKAFEQFPGLAFIREVARAEIEVPWFAIGGVCLENLSELLRAGASRVAVTGALASVADPRQAAQQWQQMLR